jgi:uncharacterized repeat protein (TIGR02543 family)
MPYCPNCGSEFNTSAKYCRTCGFHLEVEPKEVKAHEPGRKLWKKAWFLAVMGVLLVGLIIGAVLLINRHRAVQDIDLSFAKATLNAYLGYAVQQNPTAMWNMVHPDSKALFKDLDDFTLNNDITEYRHIYVLAKWNIESVDKLASWKGYSNVIACKVSLGYQLDPLVSMLELAFLGGIVPDEQQVTINMFLVKVDDQWKILKPLTDSTMETGAQIYTLTTSVRPLGAGSVIPSEGKYRSGESITLIATPTDGYTFDYWSGSASGTAPIITITMSSDKSLTANFKSNQVQLTEPIKITATELYNEYREDKARADLNYKGRILEVSGTVRWVDTLFGTTVALYADFLYSVNCHFAPLWRPELAKLEAGQYVTIQGTGSGVCLWGNPQLKNCRLK